MASDESTVLTDRGYQAGQGAGFVEAEMLSSLRLKEKFVRDAAEIIAEVAQALANCLKNGGKVLLFGNGGSAADAQHIAAEFVGRYCNHGSCNGL